MQTGSVTVLFSGTWEPEAKGKNVALILILKKIAFKFQFT